MKLIISALALSLFSWANVSAQTLESQLKERREAAASARSVEAKRYMQEGVDKLRQSNQHERALSLKGSRVPHLVFTLEDGTVRNIASYYEKAPVILLFYRGGWCPYCMLELQAYQKILPEIQKQGATLIAIAPDTYKEIAKTKRKYNLDYLIISDKDNMLAKRMGIAFKVDEQTQEIYKGFGINLADSQGNNANELPMPGTYVINKQGKIEYAFIDPDYTKRAEPSDVLSVVKKL